LVNVTRSRVPDAGLKAGDVGAIVQAYAGKRAYEVEFLTLTGRTAAVVRRKAVQVRPVGRRAHSAGASLLLAGEPARSLVCRPIDE